MLRFDARVEVLKQLKEKGLYIETKPNPMSIPVCSRTGDVIEPLLKPQWYVNCQQMAKGAIKAVHNGELTIFPKTSEKEWFLWLENIQDWCISRQLWWGHTIPAYFVEIEGEDNDVCDGSSFNDSN
jgi:valyl-tRNA synthetase